jgi:4-amino-4-deoxy-L-arabinose transferase-like glycosyltransferase
MKINKIISLIFILLFLFGIFSRIYKIETVPPHLSNDEISIAYDAFSINRTKKDEHNNYLPLSFQSHSTYKAPGYAYTLASFYSIFSNNNTTARLPSVILGFFTVFILGLITFELTKNKHLAIISSILLISSPWHIITSRMVLESNISLFFLSLAILLLLKSVNNKKNQFIYYSVFFFALSMYCYHTEWGLSPLLLFLMLFIFYRKSRKHFFIPLILFFLLILPLFLTFITNLQTSARANTEIIWKSEAVINAIKNHNIIFSPLIVVKAIFEKYLEYFNLNYLFFNGTELLGKKHLFEQGLFLWPLIFPFFVGLLNLKKLLQKKFFVFFIIFVLISPIVSSFTHGSASLVRNLNTVLPYTIIISIGLYQIFTKSKNYKSIILSILILVSFFYFSSIYLFHYPIEKAEGFQGYSSIAYFLKRDSKKYQHIYIDYKFGKSCQFIGVPHLYTAYYQSLDPKLLQNRFNDDTGSHFGKYTINQIDWNDIEFKKGDLYVVSVCNPPVPRILGKIKLTTSFIDNSGNPAFELWETK